MRVTSKGQVTIPKHVRDRLDIRAGTEVEFVTDDDGVRLVKVDAVDGAAIVAEMAERARQLRARGCITFTTEELMALTRGDGQ